MGSTYFCILHLITYYSLFLLGDESSTMFFLFTLHIFVLFVSIQFDLLFVMFSLNSVIFFCSAKSTFIHLLELHVWFGFLLLIIIIYHKYVRQYVTGIESQDKL